LEVTAEYIREVVEFYKTGWHVKPLLEPPLLKASKVA